ncbi:collagen alpha-1(V) chain-like [Myotis lucifugus]|uniref:collagen alpha-1(V) chain-like n=1 Tax=Myotis lucifugus TaxID=59463 RepID=UPI0006D71202|nr:collagen alpha-1(V) chain-like [Myotis lucifugus]
MGHPLQTLSRLPPGELSPEAGGGVQKRTLLRQLIAYLAMIAPSPTPAGPLAPDDLLRVPWRKHGKRFSPSEDPTEPLGTGDDPRARDGGAHGHGEVGPVSLNGGDVLQGLGSRRPPGAPPGAPPATGIEQAEGPRLPCLRRRTPRGWRT